MAQILVTVTDYGQRRAEIMSLLLENGTHPNGLYTKVHSSMVAGGKPICIDDTYLSYDEFLTVSYLYLTGSDIDADHNDPRPRFIEWAKTVGEVPGFNVAREKDCCRLEAKPFDSVEVHFPPPEKTAVKFKDGVLISGEDFITLLIYVLTNNDLSPDDIRRRFMESMRSVVTENSRLVAKTPFVDTSTVPSYKVGGEILIEGPVQDACSAPTDSEFFERLLKYLKGCEFGIVSMAEIAPNAIVVEDNFGSGERDLYFDSEFWTSKTKAMPMSFMRKPKMRKLKLGVLEGVSFGCPPTDAEDFLQLASQVIGPKKGIEWHKKPIQIVVPAELLAR